MLTETGAGYTSPWSGDIMATPVCIDTAKDAIVGIGNALVDILSHEDDAFVEKTGFEKGGMNYVDSDFIDKMISLVPGTPVVVPGGSACNTVVGVGKLGGKARFIGKCGQDAMGDLFSKDLQNSNVDPFLMTSALPTGRVLSIVTPDAQRSMFTYLGAASETTPGEIAGCSFLDAAVVHIEGYLLFNNDLIIKALSRAKEDGAMVSLDLASYTVVESSKELLETLVTEYVDILIANEDEAAAFTGHRDERKAIEALSERARIAVLKIGERGSYIAKNGEIVKIDPMGKGSVIDTTGAGDLWASGFLFGLTRGYAVETCGRLASACGYEVCQVVGAAISDEGWTRIKRITEE
jgi:sugar/nucleoside kinase (ribokinase family)